MGLIPSSGPSANPQLSDVFLKVKNDIFYSMNCVQIGQIESYDPITNTASISIQFQKNLANGSTMAYPLLVNCPVFVLTGGSATISMPIESGDICIVLFNDRNIDNWFYTGEVSTPANNRAHDIADGMALVGISNLHSAVPTSTSSLRIDAGTNLVAIKNDTTDLLTLINSLITLVNSVLTNIQLLTVTCAAPASPSSIPINAASFVTNATDLAALKLQFATLLNEGTP